MKRGLILQQTLYIIANVWVRFWVLCYIFLENRMSIQKRTNLGKRRTLYSTATTSDLDSLNLQTNKKPEQITLSIHFIRPFLETHFVFLQNYNQKTKTSPKRL